MPTVVSLLLKERLRWLSAGFEIQATASFQHFQLSIYPSLRPMARWCAFAVILDRRARVLLCRRVKDGKWNLPGGEVNAEEAPWDAVIREVREELNVEVQVSRVCGLYRVAAKDDLVMTFACEVTQGRPRPGDEIDQIAWFDPSDLPPGMRERHAERVRDALRTSNVVIGDEG